MIKALRITDFQSIGELDVECGPITVIYGESDTGKSAVVRALYALAFNSYPKGHVRDGAAESHISVTTEGDDELVIEATKGGGRNAYRLETPDGSELLWDKVGTDVPAEIVEALGWRAVELDDGSRFTPNFHLQFDPPFLLTDSPSRRAKVMGSLTNVATLFAAIKEANGWERRFRTRAQAHKEIYEEAEPRIEMKAEKVERLQKDLDGLQNVISGAREKAATANKLTEMMLTALQISETVTVANSIIEMMNGSDPELERIEELIPRVQGLNAALENVEFVAANIENLNGILSELESEGLAVTNELDTFMAEHKLCPLCGQPWGEGAHE